MATSPSLGIEPPEQTFDNIGPAIGRQAKILAGGYQADCYKVGASCILASVLDKGKPAAR